MSRDLTLSRKKIGSIGERLALIYLRSQGYALIEKNFRSKKGEIDLVMSSGGELVFVEVKTRQSSFGASIVFDSISKEQEQKLLQTAKAFISERLGRKWRGKFRFDAVGVILDRAEFQEIKVVQNFI